MLRLIYKDNGVLTVVTGCEDVAEARKWLKAHNQHWIIDRVNNELEAIDGLEEKWTKHFGR